MGQIEQIWGWKWVFLHLEGCKNHKVPHLHPNSIMFLPLDRLQLKIYAFSGKFNVCSKRILLSWIKNCRDFMLQTQIFTQKYRSRLRFYSEFLRKKNGSWGLWPVRAWAISLASILILGLLCFWQCLSLFVSEDKHNFKDGDLPSSAGG